MMGKRTLGFILLLVLVLGIFPVTAGAAAPIPVHTDNVGSHNYTGAWAKPVYSYLLESGSGTITRLEYTGSQIALETYDTAGQLLEQQFLEPELSLFGGFYAGTEYNFFVFGQPNAQEEDGREVLRVVRYTKDWKRLDAVGLCGANTTVPFSAGSLCMVQYGDMLYIRTSHQMYRTSDGQCHQANLSLAVQISTMTITDQHDQISDYGFGYVSHSLNQFLTLRGSTLVAADHGDAYPRSVVLTQCPRPAGEPSFSGRANAVQVLKIQGEAGDNNTGLCLGGFEASDTAYLTVGCSVDQTAADNLNGVRNIFVTSTPADQFTENATELHWITAYSSEQDPKTSNPHLVKLSGSQFLLLWTAAEQLQYCFLDGNGNRTSRVYTDSGFLSDCKPIVLDHSVWWYCTAGGEPFFYQIDLDAPEHVKALNATVTVTFSPEGGSVDPVAKTVTYGEPYGELPQPTRLDYEFLGWYLEDRFGRTQITEHSRVTIGEDHTLYAMWRYAPHTHDYTDVLTPPTCTQRGYTTHTCTLCGYTATDSYTAALGHHWDSGLLTTPPTATTPGVRTYTCTLCGETWLETVSPSGNPFVDVKTGRFYYEPVLWAAGNGVTSGIDATHFMPERACTRGQVVTFLWRAAGCPDPNSSTCPFEDVASNRFYYTAVLWAAEQGITDGMDATHFRPEATVTRGQFVTFLYRLEGQPASTGQNPFADVAPTRFYRNAVLWAAEQGITTGVDATHFRPEAFCTRGQVVTFLYRNFQ